jgi:hypothetical protein
LFLAVVAVAAVTSVAVEEVPIPIALEQTVAVAVLDLALLVLQDSSPMLTQQLGNQLMVLPALPITMAQQLAHSLAQHRLANSLHRFST